MEMLIWSLPIALFLIVRVASQDEIKFHEPTEFGAADAHVKLRQKVKRHSFRGEDGVINLEKERQHMLEHQNEIEKSFLDLGQLDDGKLLSHYFENFDLDRDGFVDGLELFKSMISMNEAHGDEGTALDIEDMMEELDEELRYYDDDNDGLVRYSEFRRHQIKRIEEKQQQQAQQ